MLKLGLLGKDIGYSLSPKIHADYYKLRGVDAEYRLIDTDDLAEALPVLRRMDGFNVTKPYKQAIIPYIDFLCTDAGAVNTVRVTGG